ncbi:BCCT, betaine/carnitine/choline family transporter [Xylophilus ampelinus]|uniref:BCCT, betaine/carnitine/choline family transporter n=1 Tax=Xylophilus ampelinus TaxID=54067 RepID=A0A318SJT7_9BURK|nr:BCCT, betaine/carnitine/choline family transporter [Xylophilus ampelinus]
MGIGLVFWGVAEPISHYLKPPPGIAAGTPEAAAMRYALFHWGLHPWAIYGIVGLAIGFFQFRRKAPALVSSATESLPWRGMWRLSPVVNVLATVATAFGVAASLGMGATQINGGLHPVFGVPVGTTAQAAIIVVTTAMFITSAVSGGPAAGGAAGLGRRAAPRQGAAQEDARAGRARGLRCTSFPLDYLFLS